VKLLVLYSGMLEDERLVRAASGALAMIAHDRVVSNKITTVSFLLFLLCTVCCHSFVSSYCWANSFIKLQCDSCVYIWLL